MKDTNPQPKTQVSRYAQSLATRPSICPLCGEITPLLFAESIDDITLCQWCNEVIGVADAVWGESYNAIVLGQKRSWL